MDIEKEKDKNRQIGLPKVCVRERERERERERVALQSLAFLLLRGARGALVTHVRRGR